MNDYYKQVDNSIKSAKGALWFGKLLFILPYLALSLVVAIVGNVGWVSTIVIICSSVNISLFAFFCFLDIFKELQYKYSVFKKIKSILKIVDSLFKVVGVVFLFVNCVMCVQNAVMGNPWDVVCLVLTVPFGLYILGKELIYNTIKYIKYLTKKTIKNIYHAMEHDLLTNNPEQNNTYDNSNVVDEQ